LQLLSEIFVLLQRALPLTDEELHDPSGPWLLGLLKGHLKEISGLGLVPSEQPSPRRLLEDELKVAGNESLGKWVARSAWELQAHIPTIEAAVRPQRELATQRRRAMLAAPFRQPVGRLGDNPADVADELHGAFHASMIIAYAQGMALLSAASEHFSFRLDLPKVSRAWRGGTWLRTGLLDDITTALQITPALPGLLSDDDLSEQVMSCQEKLRRSVSRAHELDTDVPALLASLDYLDSNRAAWLPANLIQAPPASRCPSQELDHAAAR
jgi:6-phosphogluconate dehydrogenase